MKKGKYLNMMDAPIDNIENIFTQIKNSDQEVIIFGAAVAGEAVFHMCQDHGVSVACFCDNNWNKSGKRLCGIFIRHPSEIEQYVNDPLFLISAADIRDVVEQLESMGYENWFDSSLILQDFDVYGHDLSVPHEFAEYVISTCCVCHQAFKYPDALFLRSIDIVITEKCSLRCRDCANLMQYYKKPVNYPLDDILNSIDTLSATVDHANEVRVIGGEPLMSSVFTDVVKRVIDEPKFRKIIIYTNGTICPSEEKLIPLQHPKVLFFITNYDGLSKNINGLTKQLDKLKIQWFIQQAQSWCRCGAIGHQKRSQQDNDKVFHDCCAKHLVTMMNGYLYRCPFSANAVNLKAIPPNDKDRVHLSGNDNDRQDIGSLKQGVLSLLSRKNALEVCDYCEGRPYGAPEIKPAVQTPVPLAYEKIC